MFCDNVWILAILKQSYTPCWRSLLRWRRCALRSARWRLSARSGWSGAELVCHSGRRPTPPAGSRPAPEPPAEAAEPPAGPREPAASAGRSRTETGTNSLCSGGESHPKVTRLLTFMKNTGRESRVSAGERIKYKYDLLGKKRCFY